MKKPLTGEMVHAAYKRINVHAEPWGRLREETHDNYNILAKHINQAMGLCESCGNRPDALHEVAGMMLCDACIAPPTSAQLMYPYIKPDGTLAGMIVPPKGMSLEQYQQQLQEEMEHIYFLLTGEGLGAYVADTIQELTTLITKHVPIATPDKSYMYSVQIFRDDDGSKIGYGEYKREWDDFQAEESGAAEGLGAVIYACAFGQAAVQ